MKVVASFVVLAALNLQVLAAGNYYGGPSKVARPVKFIAVLHPLGSGGASGSVTFTSVKDGIEVVADVTGLAPGSHGFHVHEYGDCSAMDGSSAGGHFNPMGHHHGAPVDPMRHAGDLGNLVADTSGHARLVWVDKGMRLSGPNSIIGRSVIVHAKMDDLVSQPTGNAGGRVACGVIGIAKAP